ncbi:MAG: D-cysteine desulfhydrase [Chlamydiia bacterium]|nr:D-cysteine desulfhydrase [Chlamydiia bacterium]
MKNTFTDFIHARIGPKFNLKSRVHSLNNQPFNGANLYLKRDDELSFGISGSKYRKYSSLIPHLNKIRCKDVALVGSANSNHLVGIMQLLNENNIRATIFTKKPREEKGNLIFLKTLAKGSSWHYLTNDQWQNKDAIISKLINQDTFFIKEGGDMLESMPGMMSLCLDFKDSNYDHIFLDAGTGFSAISTILSAKELGIKAHFHVVLMADSKELFLEKLSYYKCLLEKELGEEITPADFTLHFPSLCKSFGSTNGKVFSFIKDFAKEEGVFLDPIYSSKLVLSAYEIIMQKSLRGNILFVHSGGALTLMGFLEKLL